MSFLIGDKIKHPVLGLAGAFFKSGKKSEGAKSAALRSLVTKNS